MTSVPVFTPAQLLNFFHDIRRYGEKFTPVGNSFDVEWSTPAGREYSA